MGALKTEEELMRGQQEPEVTKLPSWTWRSACQPIARSAPARPWPMRP